VSDAAADVSAVVPLDGKGRLVFESLHHRPLYLSAVSTLLDVVPEAVVRAAPAEVDRVRDELAASDVQIRVVDAAAWWEELRGAVARPLLVHDPLCPLTPEDLLTTVLERAGGSKASVAAVRPVTDTVKTAAEGRITGTIDRSGLVVVASPVVIAASVMERAAEDDAEPPVQEMAGLVAWLRARGTVETVHAPSLGSRVDDASSVQLLESMDELSRQLRQPRGGRPVSGVPGPSPREPA
jgi:2-C-methyl-D-erythritol 4-phosphate cytidylyltransferase